MSPRCRLVVLGAADSGKTALIHRLLGRSIGVSYDPTIEDRHRVSVAFEDSSVNVDIIDTSGRELFPGMRKKYCEIGDGYVVVYSVKSRKSLREAIRISHLLGHQPRILVGAKCEVDVSCREVSLNEGRIVASQLNCSFAEASAIADINVDEVFEEIVDQLRYVSHLKKKELRRPPCCFL